MTEQATDRNRNRPRRPPCRGGQEDIEMSAHTLTLEDRFHVHTWHETRKADASARQFLHTDSCRCGATRTRLSWQDTGEIVKMAIFPPRRGGKRRYFRRVRGILEPCSFRRYRKH